jgi:hypothetical protein
MTWTKLGDEFADECWTLSDAACRLHVEGLVWSNRKGTDGRLNKDDMIRWAKRLEAAEELVAKGWWENHGDYFRIIHHIGYQRTAEAVANQSLANRANRAKGKARPVRPVSHSSDGSSDGLSDDSSDKRDRTGQDRTGLDRKVLSGEKKHTNGAVLETDECVQCRQYSRLGVTARSGENPMWCDVCNLEQGKVNHA